MPKRKYKKKAGKFSALNSRWKSLLVILILGVITLVLPYVVITYTLNTKAAPYRVPPPPPPRDEPPIPPPEENNDPPPDTGPRPTEIPTPTPCIPNWCFIEKTQCCFDPVCLFLSETQKRGTNRCPYPKPEEGVYLNHTAPPPVNFFDTLYLLFSKVTGRK